MGPTAEGLIPGPSVERLAEMGEWMRINGEAIYGSRLWAYYEDGDSVRYTWTGGDHVYAVSLRWPGRELTLHRVRPDTDSDIHLLGFGEPLSRTFDAQAGVTITIPEALQAEDQRPCAYVYVFRVRQSPRGLPDGPEARTRGARAEGELRQAR